MRRPLASRHHSRRLAPESISRRFPVRPPRQAKMATSQWTTWKRVPVTATNMEKRQRPTAIRQIHKSDAEARFLSASKVESWRLCSERQLFQIAPSRGGSRVPVTERGVATESASRRSLRLRGNCALRQSRSQIADVGSVLLQIVVQRSRGPTPNGLTPRACHKSYAGSS